MSQGTRTLMLFLCALLALTACGRQATAPEPRLDARAAEAAHGGASGLITVWPAPPMRATTAAAYCYHYMGPGHLIDLARAGFDRAIVKIVSDSTPNNVASWASRATQTGVEFVPCWNLQSARRLNALGTTRRYMPTVTMEREVGCPLDSLFWRDGLISRVREILALTPRTMRLALDLEIYDKGPLHHYDAGPCQCAGCQTEYRAAKRAGETRSIAAWEEARLTAMLTSLLGELERSRTNLELGVFDLDLDSFVHRAMARAFVATGLRTVDYCERSYRRGPAPLADARAALDTLGLRCPIVGGVLLGYYPPAGFAAVARAVEEAGNGWFVFTTYSLWTTPDKLTGPYAVKGARNDYWEAIRQATEVQAPAPVR